ncbi:MAG: regulatory protein GemA [Alphaproteobacteria bacterium]
MNAQGQAKPDAKRKRLYAVTSIAAKELGIDKDALEDLLLQRYSQPSRKLLTFQQLVDLVNHFEARGFKSKSGGKASNRKQASHPEARKIRALWIVLWNLGAIRDPSEQALAKFAMRTTGGAEEGIEDLHWVHGEDANKAIEALKAWAEREGVDWSPYHDEALRKIKCDRARVIEAQWAKLERLGVLRVPGTAALDQWLVYALNLPCAQHYRAMEAADQDRAQKRLGAWIRKVQAADA